MIVFFQLLHRKIENISATHGLSKYQELSAKEVFGIVFTGL